MKIFLTVSIFFMSFIPINKLNIEMSKDNSSYCIMSMNDKSILDSKNSEYSQSVASISKIMTAIVALEKGNLKNEIIIDDSINQSIGSSLYLKKGDTYSLKDLLYGLMLRSGNDAALMIATTISGSENKFVKDMNKKAKEIGLKQTLFKNASGLDEIDGGNISTSCDMALLMRYAMKNKIFKEIVSSEYYSPKKGVLWKNKNKFLNMFEFATGGKTGYTKIANRTLVTTSKKGDMEVVSVSLNVNDDFNVHVTMHTWAYNNFTVIKILEEGVYKYKNKKISINIPFYQTIKKEEKNKVEINTTWGKKYFKVESIYSNYRQEEKYEVFYE